MCHAAKYAPYVTRPRTMRRQTMPVPSGAAEVIVLYPDQPTFCAAVAAPSRHTPQRHRWPLGRWLGVMFAGLAAAVIAVHTKAR